MIWRFIFEKIKFELEIINTEKLRKWILLIEEINWKVIIKCYFMIRINTCNPFLLSFPGNITYSMLNRIIYRMVFLRNIFKDSRNTKSNIKTRMLRLFIKL